MNRDLLFYMAAVAHIEDFVRVAKHVDRNDGTGRDSAQCLRNYIEVFEKFLAQEKKE